MALFKKKKKDRTSSKGDSGYTPMPLLGDGAGSPWYAKGEAYKGDPTDASTDRVEAAPLQSYDPVNAVSDESASEHGSSS
ncbi:MAG: hypothetical protein WKF86_05775 [Acidimicrobiales bacterium]